MISRWLKKAAVPTVPDPSEIPPTPEQQARMTRAKSVLEAVESDTVEIRELVRDNRQRIEDNHFGIALAHAFSRRS